MNTWYVCTANSMLYSTQGGYKNCDRIGKSYVGRWDEDSQVGEPEVC